MVFRPLVWEIDTTDPASNNILNTALDEKQQFFIYFFLIVYIYS